MSTTARMFAPLPSSYIPEIRRQSMGRLFGFWIEETRLSAGLSIEDAARLSGMAVSEWMAIEDGCVPHANSRITMDIYQQTVTAERRAAQEVAFETLMGADADFSGLSSDRTHPNPRPSERRGQSCNQLILLGKW